MANKQNELNRGRMQGLDMAYRLLRAAGDDKGAKIIETEIRNRGVVPIKTAATLKELEKAAEPYKQCMYETFLCMTLMVLHDQFGFGRKRCDDFIHRWNLKTDCMSEGLVRWKDHVEAIKAEIGIDVPTECMRKEKLIWENIP